MHYMQNEQLQARSCLRDGQDKSCWVINSPISQKLCMQNLLESLFTSKKGQEVAHAHVRR